MAAFDEALALSLCCGLGSIKEGTGYEKDPDCIECLKDLQRFLRHDDPVNRDVFFFLGKMNLAKTDLVPLIITYPNETNVVYHSLKVLTFLSMPIEPESLEPQKQLELVYNVKAAIIHGEALGTLVGFLANHMHDEGMDQDDTNRVQLLVVFIRNLLSMPKSDGLGLSTHEEMLHHVIKENVLDVLIALGERIHLSRFSRDAPVLLQAFHDIFKYVDPERMLNATLKKEQETPKSETHQQISRSERRIRDIARLSRSLRYGTKFVNQCGSLIGNAVVHGLRPNPTMGVGVGENGVASTKAGKPEIKNSKLLVELRRLADQFLETSYNTLMNVVARLLQPGITLSMLEREDFLRFFQLVCFFTRYTSLKLEGGVEESEEDQGETSSTPKTSPLHLISNTMSATMLKILQGFWDQCMDTRASSRDWEMQGICVEVLKEILFVLDWAARRGGHEDKKNADKLQRRLLQDEASYVGILQVLSNMANHFSTDKQSHQDAADICECIHLAIKTYEHLLSSADGYAIKKRKRKRKMQKVDPQVEDVEGPQSEKGPGTSEKEPNNNTTSPGGSGTVGNGGVAVSQELEEGRDKDPMEELMEEVDSGSEDGVIELMEIHFDLQNQIRKLLAKPKIIGFYIDLLKGYAKNGEYLNHCVISFLRRINHPDHLNLPVLLYKVSYLRVFHGILADLKTRGNRSFQQVRHFCVKISKELIARFMKMPETGSGDTDVVEIDIQSRHDGEEKRQQMVNDECARMLFVEMLFDISPGDAEMIQNQYNIKEEYGHEEEMVENNKPYSSSEDDVIGGNEVEDFEITEACKKQLEDLFEQHNGESGCYGVVACEMGDEWTEAKVRNACRKLNLRRGRVTSNQETMLVELHSRLKSDKSCETQIAEQLPGGFTASGIHAELIRLKLIEPEKALSRVQGRHVTRETIVLSKEDEQKVCHAFESNNGKRHCYQVITEAMGRGWTKARTAKVCKQLGLKRFKMTQAQEEMLIKIFNEVKHEARVERKIASLLPGGFSSGAVRSKMKELNLVPEKKRATTQVGDIPVDDTGASNSESEPSKQSLDSMSSEDDYGREEPATSQPGRTLPLGTIPVNLSSPHSQREAAAKIDDNQNVTATRVVKRRRISKNNFQVAPPDKVESEQVLEDDMGDSSLEGSILAMKRTTLLSDSDVETEANRTSLPIQTLTLDSSDDDM